MARLIGIHAVTDIFEQAPDAIRAILHTSRPEPEAVRLLERAKKAGVLTREVPPDELRQRAGSRGGASIGADIQDAPGLDSRDLDPFGEHTVLALDQVTDPHNLGAIMRSCAAFGVRSLLMPRDNSAPLNDAAARAAAGASAYVRIARVTNLARTLNELHDRGYWPTAVSGDATESAYSAKLSEIPRIYVLGAEGHGLRPLVRKACPLAVSIPMTGLVQSLNVSVAAGILLAEAYRQHLPPSQR